MRPIIVLILSVIALAAIFCSSASGFQISRHEPSLSISSDFDYDSSITRMKRQVENFDEYPTAASEDQQEESGFWDRVVKVALKLFSRFIEWLNS